MKRNLLISMMFLAAASFAAAQIGAAPATDVLGAHLNYGRGCAGCHAPHSGAFGNGVQSKTGANNANSGNYALWGEDAGDLAGTTLAMGDGGKYVEVLPSSITSGTADASGILTCLSCHDGNLAQGAMMKNAVYETLPAGYGAGTIPTLLGNDGTTKGNYNNDHPVGTAAVIGCGGQYNWDCTVSATGYILPGPIMTQFINNYGFFVQPAAMVSTAATTAGKLEPVVVCTTCHNQHLMNVVNVTNKPFTYDPASTATKLSGTPTGLASGAYSTMFFIRAPYSPGDPASNSTAQFCRQCHGGESNEMNGGKAVTTF